MRVLGSRFIDEINGAGEKLRKKSRLVAQNYGGEDATRIATKAQTIQRLSQRLQLCLAASLPCSKVFSRDVTQAYIQATKALERPVYINEPVEMGFPEDVAMMVVKPLYGIPESGLNWYIVYMEYHIDKFRMEKTTEDPCLLVKRKDGRPSGLMGLQVDDYLTMGDDDFLREEEEYSSTFKLKERRILGKKPMSYNGV